MKEDEDYESMEEYFDAEDEALSKAIDEWYEYLVSGIYHGTDDPPNKAFWSVSEAAKSFFQLETPTVPECVKIDAVRAAEYIANWGSE